MTSRSDRLRAPSLPTSVHRTGEDGARAGAVNASTATSAILLDDSAGLRSGRRAGSPLPASSPKPTTGVPSRRIPGNPLAAAPAGARRLLASAVLVAAPALLGAGGTAHADVLVGNIDRSSQGRLNFAADSALAFTTGTNVGGYTVTDAGPKDPSNLPERLKRVPRNVALSATGVVTWTLDTQTERNSILPYEVIRMADERAPSRMNKGSSYYDYIAIKEHECYTRGSCRVQIRNFDPRLHYLVHVNTVPRGARDLRPVVLRHTPAPGTETNRTGVPRDVAVSGAGLITWRATAGHKYVVDWAWGNRRLGSTGSRHARGWRYPSGDPIRAESCAALRCEVQIPNFDPAQHWVVEVNSLARVGSGNLAGGPNLDPVRAWYAPGPRASVAGGAAVVEGAAALFTVTLSSAAPRKGVVSRFSRIEGRRFFSH